MEKHMFDGKLKLKDGTLAIGPVTTKDNLEYLFVNKHTLLDLYFTIKKNNQANWQFSGGPEYDIPNEYIQQLGNQIDYFNTDQDSIELMADGLLPKFVPKDDSIKEISFDFLMIPNLNLRVFYRKEKVEENKEIWIFKGTDLLL